jgi:hypothetical protein
MKTVVCPRLIVTLILFYTTLNKTAGQNISGIINTYHRVTAINTVTNRLTLNTAAGLNINTRVLVIQMKGATIDNSNSASFGNISAINNTGNYEFNYICAIAGNDVLLSQPLARSYTVAGSVQLVSVPMYTTVTVTGTVTGTPWNATNGTGGVIALQAETIFLNANIDASGIGFTGGPLQNYPNGNYDCNFITPVNDYFLPLMPPGGGQLVSAAPKGEGIAAFITNAEYARGKQANGGGGGNNHNSGGGGGSNYGAGGLGGMKSLESSFQCHGQAPGVGGLSLSAQGYTPANNRVYLGGGGGAGHENNAVGQPGGIGGGIVFVTANSIVGTGTRIQADGARPTNPAHAADPLSAGGDGGGGGGGGGTVVLNINSVSGNIIASAAGGRGSDAARTGTSNDCPGSGGGGGGGVVWMKGGSPIANVTSTVTGGANGVGSPLSPTVACRNTTAGATAGANGAALTGYVSPNHTGTNYCAPLPIRELKSFSGRSSDNGNILQWQMHSAQDIAGFEVERTIDRVRYETIARQDNNGNLSYTATDGAPNAITCFYRLKVVRTDNKTDYSSVIKITAQNGQEFQWLGLMPNPASEEVNIRLFVKENTTVNITLFNSPAQPLHRQNTKLAPGYSNIAIPIQKFPKGIYWVVIEANGSRLVKTLMKH